jgi:uncharacterized membrane protein
MAFVDDLALVLVLILFAGVILTYLGVSGWWAMRRNDAKGLRNAMKAAAIPIGGVGAVMMILAMWGEMTWPFPSSFGMAGYNIFFIDVMVIFGIVMVGYALTAYFSINFQYMGILALVAGAVTIFYAYTAYNASAAFTKDPFETYLLYLSFGVAGIAAFPAGIIVDLYLSAADGRSVFWSSVASTHPAGIRALGVRGVGGIGFAKESEETPSKETETFPELKFRLPVYAQLILLAFPVFMALASIAAMLYFGTTLQGHLGSGPGAAP